MKNLETFPPISKKRMQSIKGGFEYDPRDPNRIIQGGKLPEVTIYPNGNSTHEPIINGGYIIGSGSGIGDGKHGGNNSDYGEDGMNGRSGSGRSGSGSDGGGASDGGSGGSSSGERSGSDRTRSSANTEALEQSMEIASQAVAVSGVFDEFRTTLDDLRTGKANVNTLVKNVLESPMDSLKSLGSAESWKGIAILNSVGKVLGVTQAFTSSMNLWNDMTDGDGKIDPMNVADAAISIGSLAIKSNIVGVTVSMGWLLIKTEFSGNELPQDHVRTGTGGTTREGSGRTRSEPDSGTGTRTGGGSTRSTATGTRTR